MFLNKFSFIKAFTSTLFHQSKCGFVLFPSRAEWKIIQEDRYYRPFVKDDLAFPYENIERNGGPQKVSSITPLFK
jgi:hypothetical protein